MEGYEIERERKRVWSKERRSHHRRCGCDEPALPIWACFKERPPLGKRVFFYLYFFNKLCLVARKGRKVNNGVTILLIDLLGLNLIMFSLFFFLVFSLGIEIKSYISCIFVSCLKMLESL